MSQLRSPASLTSPAVRGRFRVHLNTEVNVQKALVITFRMTDGRTIHLDASMIESVTDYGEMSFIEMKSGAKHTVVGKDADVLKKIYDALGVTP